METQLTKPRFESRMIRRGEFGVYDTFTQEFAKGQAAGSGRPFRDRGGSLSATRRANEAYEASIANEATPWSV